MADEALLRKVHQLGDLELATLLSLVAREHCLISTAPDCVDLLAHELSLVATQTFGLEPGIVTCHAHTTLDDFTNALLLPPAGSSGAAAATAISPVDSSRSVSPYQTRNDHATGSYFPQRGAFGTGTLRSVTQPSTKARIPHVVLAKNLDQAPKAVQIQALELLRTRRIFTRTAVQTAPKQFLFVAVLGAASGGEAHVTQHLNDAFYLSHWHDPEDGFPLLDGQGPGASVHEQDFDDRASTTSSESVLRRSPLPGPADIPRESIAFSSSFLDNKTNQSPIFSEGDVAHLAQLGERAHVDIDVMRYQMNVLSFLRMHRAVAGGMTPTATKHFEQLAKSLAPLHGLDYVTPSLVGLAAKKIYLHRIRMVAPDKERSMQWGSELAAIEMLLDGVGPEDVLDDVLSMVSAPQ